MIHLFFDSCELSVLLDNVAKIGFSSPRSRKDWFIDFIDLPTTLEIVNDKDSETYTISLARRFAQSDYSDNNEPRIISYEESDDYDNLISKIDSGEDKDIEWTLGTLVSLCAERYLDYIDFWSTNEIPDKEYGGILIYSEDEEIKVSCVYGEDRPDLASINFSLCFTERGLEYRMDDEYAMIRPYADEQDNDFEYLSEDEDEEPDDDDENTGGEEFLIKRNVLLSYDGEDENVVIPDGVTTIGNGSKMPFYQKKVVSVKIPDTVTSIGAYGFFACDTLQEIYIPDSVVSIGDHAFRQCTSLKSVAIPDSVSCIERECFWSCTGIEEVKLPKNLKFIEEKAFSGCISLRSVVIPEGTEVIDDCAFWGDESLESITIPASVKRIGEMAFADCNNLTIYTPRGSKAERYAKKHRISYKTMKNSAIESMSLKDKEEAANAGDVDLMEQLAMDYLNGDGVAIDPEKAYYWFVKCAEVGGSGQAMFNVGLLTAKGFGVERDFAKAAEWMQKAADEEDEDAKACVDEYRKLADATEKAIAGDAQAQADLASGLMKLSDSLIQAGEDKDFEESVMWAEKAVAQGCPDGYFILALAYHHGRGVAQDIDKAIEIYQKGADAGNAPCQYNLGCQYMSGENIEKDRHKGFALIKAAAEQGYGLAMKDLGKCYQFAIGTPGNMKRAYEWYEKALEVIDDIELEQKVMMLGMISTTDHFDEDYPEDDGDFDGDFTEEDEESD